MKNSTWIMITVLLTGLCVFNAVRTRRAQNEFSARMTKGKAAASNDTMWGESSAMDLSLSGKIINWPEDLAVIGEGEPDVGVGYRLVLAFREISCDVCRDEETTFLKQMASHIGADSVRVLVQADDARYVRAYKRMNQLAMPVLYDKTGAFFETNKLVQTPVIMLLNDRNEVLAAHHPVVGQPRFSKPFHWFCNRFFDVPGDDAKVGKTKTDPAEPTTI